MMGNVQGLLLETEGQKFVVGLLEVIWMITVAIGIFLTVYAVFIMYQFATASTEDKRRAAKKRIFTVSSSVFIIIALVFSLAAIKDSINITRVSGGKYNDDNDTKTNANVVQVVNAPKMELKIVNQSGSKKVSSGMPVYGTDTISSGMFAGDEYVNTEITGRVTLSENNFKLPSGAKLERIVSVNFSGASGILDKKFWTLGVISSDNGAVSYQLDYHVWTFWSGSSGGNTTGHEAITFMGNGRGEGVTDRSGQIFLYTEITLSYQLGEGENAVTGLQAKVNTNLWLQITGGVISKPSGSAYIEFCDPKGQYKKW